MLIYILAVEIEVNHEPIVFCVCYGPPIGSTKSCNEILQECLDILSRKHQSSILIGDFNIDLSLLRNRGTSNLHTCDVVFISVYNIFFCFSCRMFLCMSYTD